MKPKFAYIYISFIVSLAIVVILSTLFYKKLNTHLKYTEDSNRGYQVIIKLGKLEEKMVELENYSLSYIVMEDSSYYDKFTKTRDSIHKYLVGIEENLDHDSDQMRHFRLMRTLVSSQTNAYQQTMERVQKGDTLDRLKPLQRSKELMNTFRKEARQIERGERKIMEESYQAKELFQDYSPGYFNTISIWAGIVTLVSFYFIHREMTMRTRYQRELERKLQELKRSNSELQQFAYIASHDLQEPLRKIRTFSDKLVVKHKDQIDNDAKMVISRIEASAERMQELIQDMLNFTSLVNKEEKMSMVDLNNVMVDVLKDFAPISKSTNAIISWDTLPMINGSVNQLTLLFRSLFDNAFKFAKPGEAPVIRINYQQVESDHEKDVLQKGNQYHKIVIEDKGIGFNNEFAEKIFMIFQRLHSQQSGYRGKGIGLAIAQRIVVNHNGIIMAKGRINDGATFIMYFPVEQ